MCVACDEAQTRGQKKRQDEFRSLFLFSFFLVSVILDDVACERWQKSFRRTTSFSHEVILTFFIDVPVGSVLFQEIVKSFIISWNIINY